MSTDRPLCVEAIGARYMARSEKELTDILALVHGDRYAAFVLTREGLPASLWLHFNHDWAYLHYFSGEDEDAGLQAQNMSITHGPDTVHFLQTSGVEADAFDMDASAVLMREMAVCAALEFFRNGALPSSVSWFAL